MLKLYASDIFGKNLVRKVDFELLTFNGGEPHVKIPEEKELMFCIEARIQSFNDLGELFVLCDALTRAGKYIGHIRVPYFPGARQDRVANKGEALTAKVYADLFNELGCTIEIVDPHSDVTPALLNKYRLYPIENIVAKAIEDCKPDCIIIPDEGASKRTRKYIESVNKIFEGSHVRCNNVNYNPTLVQCLKVRDTKTGKLTGFKVCSDEDFTNKKLLVIDDLCENGGTFLGLAQEFKKKSTCSLNLYFTHGILPKGQENLDSLYQYFDKIYSTDSFNNNLSSSDKFIVYPLY